MACIPVVDDVAQVRTAVGRALALWGHEVVEAENGGAALCRGGLPPKELLLDTAATLGVVVTIPKPLELDRLQEAVHAALARSRGAA